MTYYVSSGTLNPTHSPHTGLSARVPKCQKIKNGGLDQYGPEHFEV